MVQRGQSSHIWWRTQIPVVGYVILLAKPLLYTSGVQLNHGLFAFFLFICYRKQKKIGTDIGLTNTPADVYMHGSIT